MAFVPRVIGFWLITAMSFMAMCVSTMFTVSIYTVVQQRTPIHLLGKIMASIIAIASCSQPIGQALYGILFEKLYAMGKKPLNSGKSMKWFTSARKNRSGRSV